MNHLRGAIACLGVLLAGFSAFSQCPAGFIDAGTVSATAAPGRYQQVQVTRKLNLPDGIQIDDSYRQGSIQAASDGGASNLKAARIPAGLQLIPGGTAGGSWWSIENPELNKMSTGENAPVHWAFQIDLYANTGGRGQTTSTRDQAQASPSVWVDVCVKTRE